MSDLIPAWCDDRLAPMDKIAVHRQGLRHMAVSVFVLCQGRTLIQRRALEKYHTPGLWANSCCTHPHWHEAPADCARRRLHQELGITAQALRTAGQVEYRADVGNGMVEHEVVDIFAADMATPPALHPDPAEVVDTRWVTVADLIRETREMPALFTPWLRIYLRDHVEMILGAGAT